MDLTDVSFFHQDATAATGVEALTAVHGTEYVYGSIGTTICKRMNSLTFGIYFEIKSFYYEKTFNFFRCGLQ